MSHIVYKPSEARLVFGDVFAGCGGLSLGLINAGWKGLFAIEQNANAFETLKTNLLSDQQKGFDWPQWLPATPMDATCFINRYGSHLSDLKGKLDLLAGGPPCQGFSMAGRRIHADPRNALTEEYIRIIQKLEPRLLLIENVQGFTLSFKKNGNGKEITLDAVQKKLESIGIIINLERLMK